MIQLHKIFREIKCEIIYGVGINPPWKIIFNPARFKFWVNLRHVKRIDNKYGTCFYGQDYGRILPNNLGIDSMRGNDYSASPRDIVSILNTMDISDKDAIIDIGCGEGLAMYYMDQFPFSRIAGLELSEVVANKVYDNLLKISRNKYISEEGIRLRFSVIVADAGKYDSYDLYNYFYVYNSLPKGVMREFVKRVEESICRSPRKVHLLYLMPEYPDEVLESKIFKLTKRGKKSEIRYGMWIFEN